MTDLLVHNPFGFLVMRTRSISLPEEDYKPLGPVGTIYRCRGSGLLVDGSWEQVAARVSLDASTSWLVSPVRALDNDPHPKPVASSRVRSLKEDSGLTWDQLRRLFGVSLRSVHLWASGTRMNTRNGERLSTLERIVRDLDVTTPDQRREALLCSPVGGGRSIFQQLVLDANHSVPTDIEARMKSSGAGFTVHGDFLFAEEIADGEEDR